MWDRIIVTWSPPSTESGTFIFPLSWSILNKQQFWWNSVCLKTTKYKGNRMRSCVPVLQERKGILHEKHFVIITSSGFCVDLSIHVHLGYPGAQYHEREHHLHVTCEKHETHGRFQWSWFHIKLESVLISSSGYVRGQGYPVIREKLHWD